MNRRTFLKTIPAAAAALAGTASPAQEAGPAPASRPALALPPITLPQPQKESGKSVLAALWERRTNRSIREQALPPQILSNLLWAAWGVNRRETGGQVRRTAASASNSQEIDLYVVLPQGAYLYEAETHRLDPVVAGDLRRQCGRQSGVARAPVNLVFVADLAKYARGRPQEPGLKDPEIQKSYSNIATGLIAGNVYLYCASEGLAAWFHNCSKPALTAALKLRPEQRPLYAQTVGYPA